MDWKPCRLKAEPYLPTVQASCRTLKVPLDPAVPDGDTIELFLARVGSMRATPAPDPFVFLTGGPGQSAIDSYVTSQGAFELIRRARDILLIDQRGTGRSAKLECPMLAAIPEDELTLEAVTSCLKALPHDPRFFTTSVAVRDLERVRVALGIERWNLYGVSYGTRVATHYLRRYPDSVRTLILDGVIGVDRVLGPSIAKQSQETLDALFARCRSDEACSERFGDPSKSLKLLLARLKEAPAEGSMMNSDGRPETSELSLDALRGALRLLAYQAETQALIPYLIHEAVKGNVGPLVANARVTSEQLTGTIALGMHNAVVCSEDLPLAGDGSAGGSSYMGTSLLESMRTLCNPWPKGSVDTDFREPIVSPTPILLLSGEMDPATPPSDADKLARGLSDSAHLVIPGRGHSVASQGCVPRLMSQFINAGSSEDLDSSCIDQLGPFPFVLDANGPAP